MGKWWEPVTDFSFWGAPKSLQMVTAAMKVKDAFSFEEKLWQPRWHIKKQRHHFSHKGLYSPSPKTMVFPVIMYGCEIWTIKKTEHRRIDAFELYSLKRLLRVPWTARRSNHSILKEIGPDDSLKGLMLKLKLQYFGHLMPRADSLEKTLMLERLKAGGGGANRGWDDWMATLTWRTWIWASSGIWWWTGRPGMLQSMESQRVGHN